ncbi:thiol reductant ABC exporter subunit CydD [Oceanobacillus halotolerans]|uniref:thiol reductant ABC exporter subunit CydD n=1 Tax=Oceanobacillus halotolerans TaxID=2663380 RepID=UPI001CF7EA7B|nr:thiol reductant ABC exporter subunit CydD [Oceanobacillus halotolerans]
MQLKDLVIRQKRLLYPLILFALLTGLAIVMQAYYMVAIVDHVFLQQESFQAIIPLLIGLLVVLLLRAVFHFVNGKMGIQLASQAKQHIRESLIRHYTKNPIQAALQGQSGQRVSLVMDVVDELDSYFKTYIPQVIQTSIIPLIILIVAFTQHIYTGIIILITAPFIPLFMFLIGKKTNDKSVEKMDEMASFSGQFLDTLQGIMTLRLFGRSKQQEKSIEKASNGFKEATMDVLKVAFTNSLMLELISMLSMGLIALEVAIRLIIFQDISFFTAFFMLVLAPEFYTALKELGNAFHAGRGSMGAAEKIQAELELSDEAVSWGNRQLDTAVQPPKLSLQNVSFQYQEGGFALQQIRADILPYQQVAIVGKSGSGKTTLLQVLAGVVTPMEGDYFINDRPRSIYQEADWFDAISYISQDPYLFSGTIEENISIGTTRKASRHEVQRAAEKAGIMRFVVSLDQGLDTTIGEGGRGLSGGEKQRIALARAFLKQPSVVLFDEPTTGLDLETERILQVSIAELAKEATMITVAHRLHTIQQADQIMFLEDGKLLAVGTHSELLKQVGAYHKMVTIQRGGAIT